MRKQLSLRLGKDSKDGDKSKKKLSFREPEVEEKPKASSTNESEVDESKPKSAILVYPGALKKIDTQKKGGVREVTFNLERRDSDSSCSLDDLELESQAMRIVRTVGQAFEVCHKLSLTQAASSTGTPLPSSQGDEDSPIEKAHDISTEFSQKGHVGGGGAIEKDNTSGNPSDSITNISPNSRSAKAEKSVISKEREKLSSPHSLLSEGDSGNSASSLPEGTPLAVYHQVQLLKEQLEQQSQQMQSTTSQLQLLKDQLSAETAARVEAQAQNTQLLQHNKELLDHIRVLVKHIQDLESKVGTKSEMSPMSMAQNVASSSHSSSQLYMPEFLQTEQPPSLPPQPPPHTSPSISLGRSNSANYPSSSAEALLKRTGIVRSPSSASSGRVSNQQQDQSSSISQLLGGLSLPNSPTLQPSGYSNTSLSGSGNTSNFENIFQGLLGNQHQQQQANRSFGSTGISESAVGSFLSSKTPSDSPTSYNLSPSPAVSINPSSSLLAGTIASLPKLNPPPQKPRTSKPLEQLSMFGSSKESTRLWAESSTSQAGPSTSNNPSRLTTNDILTWSPQIPSSSLPRQFSQSMTRSPKSSTSMASDQESSVSQVLRDLSRMSLSEKNNSKGNDSRSTSSDTNFSRYYRS